MSKWSIWLDNFLKVTWRNPYHACMDVKRDFQFSNGSHLWIYCPHSVFFFLQKPLYYYNDGAITVPWFHGHEDPNLHKCNIGSQTCKRATSLVDDWNITKIRIQHKTSEQNHPMKKKSSGNKPHTEASVLRRPIWILGKVGKMVIWYKSNALKTRRGTRACVWATQYVF